MFRSLVVIVLILNVLNYLFSLEQIELNLALEARMTKLLENESLHNAWKPLKGKLKSRFWNGDSTDRYVSADILQVDPSVVWNAYLNYGGFGCLAHRLVEVPGGFPNKKKEQQGGVINWNRR